MHIFAALGTALLVLLSSHAFADDMNDQIERSLKLSGLSSQLDDLSGAILSAIPSDALPTPRLRQEAAAFVKKAAGKNLLQDMMSEAVRGEMDRNSLEQVVRFYESKVGRKLGKLHEGALETGQIRNIRESRNLIVSLSDSRLALLKRLVDSEQIADTNRTLMHTMTSGLVEAATAGSEELGQETREIVKQLEGAESRVGSDRAKIDENALTAFAYTYRSLDDKELQEVVSFYESDPSKQFGRAMRTGLQSVVHKIAVSLGEAALKWKNEGLGD